MNDCKAKLLVTADGAWRGEKLLHLKELCDEAMMKAEELGHNVETCIVVSHIRRVTPGKGDLSTFTGIDCPMKEDRDFWWHDEMEDAEPSCYPEWMSAEDPLFMLYTSGSTGKPKGVLHTTGGYLLYAATTFKFVFDYKPNDVYWCTADIGWITGHTYVVYGPLANGATSVMVNLNLQKKNLTKLIKYFISSKELHFIQIMIVIGELLINIRLINFIQHQLQFVLL